MLDSLSRNQEMAAGFMAIAGVVAASSPLVKDKIKSAGGMFSSLWGRITGGSSSTIKVDDVHKLSGQLIDYFAKTDDETGVRLAAAVGQHIYGRAVEKCHHTKPTPSAPLGPSLGASNEELAS